ncbi:MAG TPA: hypothetical protein VMT30_06010 [Candidatus Saccharimonadia bacterium]|nr:hypothetical protein [Candidatus Saccharimonadia bacterium]
MYRTGTCIIDHGFKPPDSNSAGCIYVVLCIRTPEYLPCGQIHLRSDLWTGPRAVMSCNYTPSQWAQHITAAKAIQALDREAWFGAFAPWFEEPELKAFKTAVLRGAFDLSVLERTAAEAAAQRAAKEAANGVLVAA